MAIRKVVRKYKLGNEPSDFEYWQSRPYGERIKALEDIRSEYNRWKYHAEQGIRKVYKIVKQMNNDDRS